MSFCECVVDPNILLLPVVLIFLYLGDLVVSIVNTAEYFQKRKDVYSPALIAAHLSFCVVGAVAFFCVSSVLWLWSAKYAFTHAEHMWRLCVGLWFVFFLKDLPLTIIETHAYLQVGWQNGNFMDASFLLQVIFFVPSALATSATISWYASGFLERQFGDALQVALQEKEGPRRVPADVAAQLANAAVVRPPLPLQEPRLSTAHPPRVYDGQGHVHDASHEPLAAPAPNNYVVAEYTGDYAPTLGGPHVRFALDDVRPESSSEDDAGPYPAVI